MSIFTQSVGNSGSSPRWSELFYFNIPVTTEDLKVVITLYVVIIF